MTSSDAPFNRDKDAARMMLFRWSFLIVDWLAANGHLAPKGYLDGLRLLGESTKIDNAEDSVAMIKRAAEGCEQLPEAQMLISEFEPNPSKVLGHFEKAFDQSAWLLNPPDDDDLNSENLERHFYGLSLVLHMSNTLWGLGQRVSSVEFMQQVHRYDPEDLTGVHFVLAVRLIEMGWLDEADEIASELLEKSKLALAEAEMLPAAKSKLQRQHQLDQLQADVLHLLQDLAGGGPTDALADLVRKIDEGFPQYIEYLLGYVDPSDVDIFGDQLTTLRGVQPRRSEETFLAWLAMATLPVFRSLPNAITWVRSETTKHAPPAVASFSEAKEALRQLSLLPKTDDEVWLVVVRKTADDHLIVIYCENDQDAILVEPIGEKPTAALLWKLVSNAMFAPNYGMPRRPETLVVSRKSTQNAWRRRCKDLEIECRQGNVDHADDLVDSLWSTIEQVELRVEIDELLIGEIEELPTYEDVWVLAAFQPPIWTFEDGHPKRPHVILVGERESGFVLMHDIVLEMTPDHFSQAVAKAMLMPLGGDVDPHQPAEIKIQQEAPASEVVKLCQRLEIPTFFSEDITELDEYLEEMVRHCSGEVSSESLFDVDRIEVSDLRCLFESSARFYKSALWQSVPGDRPIEMTCPDIRQEPWCVVVVGQLGMNMGLVVYDSLEEYEAALVENSDSNQGVFLNYVEAHEMVPIDLWLAEQHNFRIASQDAYPLIDVSLGKGQFRRPTYYELKMIDASLCSLPAFASQSMSDQGIHLPTRIFGKSEQLFARWA